MASPALEISWNGNSSRSNNNSSSAHQHHCPSCHRIFKRIEHLRRHQRSHDGNKTFICGVCAKGFARRDILNRHESIHTAASQAIVLASKRRACQECARAKAACSRNEPCVRCSARALRCTYAQELPSDAISEGGGQQAQMNQPRISSSATATHAQVHHVELQAMEDSPMVDMSNHVPTMEAPDQGASQHIYQNMVQGPFSPVHAASGTSSVMVMEPTFRQAGMAQPEYPQQDFLDPNSSNILDPSGRSFHQLTDFPMNWLPFNESITIDYSSILGFGVSSLGLFSTLPEDMVQGSPFGNTAENLPSNATRMPNHVEDTRIHESRSLHHRAQSTQPRSPLDNNHLSVHSASPMSSTGTISSRSQHSLEIVPPMSVRGGLYATNSNGARLPCTARFKRPRLFLPSATPLGPISDSRYSSSEGQESLKFPDLSHMHVDYTGEDLGIRRINHATYETIKRHFEKLCLEENVVFSSYGTTEFPPLHHLNLFVRLYYDNFDPILPILHDQLVLLNDYWPLALAISVIGCQYTETNEFSQCVEPLHEFLRRVIVVETESAAQTEHTTALAQTLVLNQIGTRYFGPKRLFSCSRSGQTTLIDMINSPNFLKSSRVAGKVHQHNGAITQKEIWEKALAEEAKRRLRYTIWLLNCMAVYHFDEQPLFSLNVTQHPLPQDRVWLTKTYDDWLALPKLDDDPLSLSAAVQLVFREKKMPHDLSEFSRTLLLHGVFQEIFHLKSCLTRPLATWVPSLQQLDGFDDNPRSPPVLDSGARSQLSSWRNAALDCVDVLHWAAMATVARLAGAENPTVLHLHFARVILLVPFTKLRILASSIASVAQDSRLEGMRVPTRQEAVEAEREVIEWAQRDEHKARLAVLHCGCLYWHIRRYSCGAFYEPISVFLATLTIWAYSSYASRTPLPDQQVTVDNCDGSRSGSVTRQPSPEAPSPSGGSNSNSSGNTAASTIMETDPEPTFVRLDRPNDDEMVQLYVRLGRPSSMRAYITGVGNIYSPQGPAKVLREGRKILSAVSSAWGRTQEYTAILAALEKVSSNVGGGDPGV